MDLITIIASHTLAVLLTWGATKAWYDYRYDNSKKVVKTLTELTEIVKKLDK